MNWKDTHAVITGASQGLGAALARLIAEKGAQVALVARHQQPLEKVVAEIRARGGTAFAIVADVADKDSTHRISGQAAALLGRIDLLVHNASTLGPTPMPLLLDTDCETLESVLQTNLVGPFRLTKAIAGPMALRRSGTIVHLSSDAAVEPYPGWGSYAVSKAAQDHLSRILGAELMDAGVRVLTVDPGEMNTQMHRDALPDADVASLLTPQTVAARLVRMLEDSSGAPSGTRQSAQKWEAA